MDGIELLRVRAEMMNIELDETQLAAFREYNRLLTEWNGRFNLTAIREETEVIEKHFLDSLSIAPIVESVFGERESGKTVRLIDIGAGAGFPGIPLRILYGEQLSVTLVDSVAKKVGFLKEALRVLGLAGCEAVHGRVEDIGQLKEYREQFQIATARALAAMPVLLEYALPFIRQGGYLIAMKAAREGAEREVEESSRALKLLGGEVHELRELNLPMSDLSRTAVIIKKCAKTPRQYPRKAGTISKNPL